MTSTVTGSPPSRPTPPGGNSQALELRLRRRARCEEDRIRCAKDTGLSSLPFKGSAANRIWCHLVVIAGDLIAWMQLLALEAKDPPRRWKPNGCDTASSSSPRSWPGPRDEPGRGSQAPTLRTADRHRARPPRRARTTQLRTTHPIPRTQRPPGRGTRRQPRMT